MTDATIQELFLEWWASSYGRPPGSHAVMTHVAFAEHLLQVLRLMEELDP